MITNRELHENLVRWIAATTGYQTILARQGAARPNLPYIMVNFTGWDPLHYHPAETEFEDIVVNDVEKVRATPVQDAEWRYSIFSYCGDDREPEDMLMQLHSACKVAQVMEPIFPDFVIHDLSQVRSVPEYVQNTWEPRAQMDLFLRGVTRYGHVIDVIETAEYNITEVERVD